MNLLDPDSGARLLAANQDDWRRLFSGAPSSVYIRENGFVIVALRGDAPSVFDTLAFFVEASSAANTSELIISAS